MDPVADATIMIEHERFGASPTSLLERLGSAEYQRIDVSVITILELTHGIFRARSSAVAEKRRHFVSGMTEVFHAQPITVEIAQEAGEIEGRLAAQGVSVDLADLLMGATAKHLGCAVLTLNSKHFELIAGLQVVEG